MRSKDAKLLARSQLANSGGAITLKSLVTLKFAGGDA